MKNWQKNIISWLAVAVVTLLLFEIMSLFFFKKLTKTELNYSNLKQDRNQRIEYIKSKYKGGKTSGGFFVFHPYTGYIGHPGVYAFGKDTPPLFKQVPPFNNYGMISYNNHPYPYKKKKNDFVVAVLGGSVAEQFVLTAEKHLEACLKKLDKAFENINLIVLTFATGGYKQPQQTFALQYALMSGFEIDAVINLDGFNEIVMSVDNIDHNINPVFPSGYHMGLMSKTKSVEFDLLSMKHFSNIYNSYMSELRLISIINKFPFRYSVFCNLIGTLFTKYSKKLIDMEHYNLVQEAKEGFTEEFKGPKIKLDDNKYIAARKIWIKGSELLKGICSNQQMVYVHLLQPNLSVKGSKIPGPVEKKFLESNNVWDNYSKNGYPVFLAAKNILLEKQIPFYDMTMIFKDIKEDLYFDGCHFNIRGNNILAEHTAKILDAEIKKQKNSKIYKSIFQNNTL